MNNTPYINENDYNEDLDSPLDFSKETINILIPIELAGNRLDTVVAKLLPKYSRSRLTEWIKNGHITLNKQNCTPKHKVIGGESLVVQIQESEENLAFTSESIPLDIVYEDDTIIVINKPANLVVHPATGNWTGTLLNGLLHHCPALKNVPRAGIVHRLDKDTTGLMVIAKTLIAQNNLVQQLQARTVKRIYRAVTNGIIPFDGKIETLIGRDPHNRTKMAVVKFNGKPAITHIKVLERYLNHSYIECSLETGRTHQIRVHMKEAKHPLAGDPLYGNPRHPVSEKTKESIQALNRQALHAYRLSFLHPESNELAQFQADLPQDMYLLLSVLRWESGKQSPFNTELGLDEISTFHNHEDEIDNHDEEDVEIIYTRE